MSVSKSKEDIAIVGAGTLAAALVPALYQSGYRIREIVTRNQPQSLRRARALAKRVHASATTLSKAQLGARITWICVPDDSIPDVAQSIARQGDWRRKIVVHSSGALGADALAPAKQAGAETASAHPLMTFVSQSSVNQSSADFKGVPFAMEGDPKAMVLIGAVVVRLGGKPFRIAAEFKPAYHAFGFFSSPALVALIAAAQQVGKLAGLSERQARRLMEPIVRQTLDNCFRGTAGEAFSGPLRRGDVATVRKHLEVLKDEPHLIDLYRALSRVALQYLPVCHSDELSEVIGD
jgi:predicted short-subunit dehydrogenase-like oxidoreductase (DUF2520 family)